MAKSAALKVRLETRFDWTLSRVLGPAACRQGQYRLQKQRERRGKNDGGAEDDDDDDEDNDATEGRSEVRTERDGQRTSDWGATKWFTTRNGTRYPPPPWPTKGARRTDGPADRQTGRQTLSQAHDGRRQRESNTHKRARPRPRQEVKEGPPPKSRHVGKGDAKLLTLVSACIQVDACPSACPFVRSSLPTLPSSEVPSTHR
jgi:hypothetical protein